jgi:hypothetical protein
MSVLPSSHSSWPHAVVAETDSQLAVWHMLVSTMVAQVTTLHHMALTVPTVLGIWPPQVACLSHMHRLSPLGGSSGSWLRGGLCDKGHGVVDACKHGRWVCCAVPLLQHAPGGPRPGGRLHTWDTSSLVRQGRILQSRQFSKSSRFPSK